MTRTAARMTSALVVIVACAFASTAAGAAEPAGVVQFASRTLEFLAGPLTPPGVPKGTKLYDSLQLTEGRLYAESFSPGECVTCANYYDLALTFYLIHYRTRDTYWLEKARSVARTWRDAENNRAIVRVLAGDWSAGPLVPPPRSMSTLGLAILATEANDAMARQVVRHHATLVQVNLHNFATNRPWGDQRERGFGLMALVAATLLGGEFTSTAQALLNTILTDQQPDGHWESTYGCNVPYSLNFMTGILMEGMIFYDRAIGDPRILPAIQKALKWLWTTQWVSQAQAFQYATAVDTCGENTNAYANLNGLLLPAWAYAYYRSGDTEYLRQGNQILAGILSSGGNEIHGVKQFAQLFRSSSRYFGYVTLGSGTTSHQK